MLPINTFRVVFIATKPMSKEEFQGLIAPGLECLDSYIQAFDSKKTSAVSYYEPNHDARNEQGWSARCVLLLSVGRARIPHLHHLFDITVHHIGCIVDPVIDVDHDAGVFEFEK